MVWHVHNQVQGTERYWTEIFETCGEPAETIRTILMAVDKLDKMPWSMVRRELVEEKGLKANVAGRIEGVCDAGKAGDGFSTSRVKMGELTANANARAGIEEMGLLIDYVTALGVLDDRISFDMSLARGLDCSTGHHLRDRHGRFSAGRCKRWRRRDCPEGAEVDLEEDGWRR